MAQSTLITTVRNLRYRKARRRRGLAVLEGIRLVGDALECGVRVQGLLVQEGIRQSDRLRQILRYADSGDWNVETIPADLISELADTEHSQGILAVVEQPGVALASLEVPPASLVLVIDAVQDPGNVGTMIRSAHSFGVAAVVLLEGSADLWNPKVLRAAMGASFRVPVVGSGVAEFSRWASKSGIELWAGTLDGEPLRSCRREEKTIGIVVGNEGAGLSAPLSKTVKRRITIPMTRSAESLNVATAAAIIMYQLTEVVNAD